MYMQLFLLSCLLAAAAARPDQPVYPDEPAKYSYQYGVTDEFTNNNFGQAENRWEDPVKLVFSHLITALLV